MGTAATTLPHATITRRGQATREAIWFYIFISPWLVGFLLFTAGPIIASALLSFTHNDPVNWPPKWVGLANYQLMWSDPVFWKSLQVTFYYTFASVPLSVSFATAGTRARSACVCARRSGLW